MLESANKIEREVLPVEDAIKIWTSDWFNDPKNVKSISFKYGSEFLKILNRYERAEALSRDEMPERIFFALYDLREKKKSALQDFFLIANGIAVISERLADVLRRFDLGDTQMFPVGLYEYDRETRRPGTWFILNIAARKDCFVPEASEKVNNVGVWLPQGRPTHIAVRASSAVGADLWMDPSLLYIPFLSDRLVKAIRAEKIRPTLLHPCIVV